MSDNVYTSLSMQSDQQIILFTAIYRHLEVKWLKYNYYDCDKYWIKKNLKMHNFTLAVAVSPPKGSNASGSWLTFAGSALTNCPNPNKSTLLSPPPPMFNKSSFSPNKSTLMFADADCVPILSKSIFSPLSWSVPEDKFKKSASASPSIRSPSLSSGSDWKYNLHY